MSFEISEELSNRLQIRPPVPQPKTLGNKLKGKGEEIFAAAGPILNCLREVASLTPVPYLRQAAGLSVSLWTTIDAVRDNQANFERLRNTAVRLVIGLDASFNQSENANQWMDAHVTKIFRAIISDLQSVTAFCEEVTRRPLYKRAMFSMTDKGKIKEFDDRFRNAVLEFQTLSHVKLHESLAKLNDKSTEIIAENRKGVKTIIENDNSNLNTIMSELKITQAMVRSIGARNHSGSNAVVTTTTMVDVQSRESRSSNQHLRPPSTQSTGRISTPSESRRGSPTPSAGSGRSQQTTSRPSKSSKSQSKRTSSSSKRRSKNYETESEEEESDQLSSEEEESEASGEEEEEESEDERDKRKRSHCRKGSSSRRRQAPSPSPSPSPVRRPSPSPVRQPSPRPDHTPPMNPPPIFAHAPPSSSSPYPGNPPPAPSPPSPSQTPFSHPFPPSPTPPPSSYTPPPPSDLPRAYPSPPPSSYSHASYGSYPHYTPPPVFQGTLPPGFGPAHLAPGAVMQVGSGTNIYNVGNTYGGHKTVYETRIVAETAAPSFESKSSKKSSRKKRA